MSENTITDAMVEDARKAGYDYYPGEPQDNPYNDGTQYRLWFAWDAGFWKAHNDSFVADDHIGIEAGYGDFYDMDAVSQGFYDDDPSPYSGTYSEM